MTDAPATALTLSGTLTGVRKDIDAIDDAILELLAKRFAVVEQVRELKKAQAAASPLRPAREAQVLQRLCAKARAVGLNPELPVWLWPVIFAEADLVQAPVRLVIAEALGADAAARLAIQQRFGRIPVALLADDATALQSAFSSPLDVAIVNASSAWLEVYLDHYFSAGPGRAHVMGVIDVMPATKLVVIGQSPVESTGRDETLVVSRGSLPREFPLRPLWSIVSGSLQLSALPGFLSEKEAPLLGIIRSNGALGLKVAGRYPAQVR